MLPEHGKPAYLLPTMSNSDVLLKQALRQLAQLEMASAEQTERLQTRLQHWRSRSEGHESAYQQAIGQMQALLSLAPSLQAEFSEPTAQEHKQHAAKKRRAQTHSLLGWGVLALAAAALLKAGHWYWQQPVFEADYHTGVAEVRQITLPDGSHLAINAQSALHVSLYRQQRLVALQQGEVHFTVSPDRQRPFMVSTQQGSVEVVGTIFTVSQRQQRLAVNVEQGHVRYYPPSIASHPQTEKPVAYDLLARDQLLSQAGVIELGKVDAADASAWRSGWLVFNNMPLADALPLINAFRQQPLTIADAHTAQLRLSGRFRAQDQQALERALPVILPLQLIPGATETQLKSR